MKGLRKATKNLRKDTWSLGQDLNSEPSKYGAGVLTTLPQGSVLETYIKVVKTS
jgi:hypothetical protein